MCRTLCLVQCNRRNSNNLVPFVTALIITCNNSFSHHHMELFIFFFSLSLLTPWEGVGDCSLLGEGELEILVVCVGSALYAEQIQLVICISS